MGRIRTLPPLCSGADVPSATGPATVSVVKGGFLRPFRQARRLLGLPQAEDACATNGPPVNSCPERRPAAMFQRMANGSVPELSLRLDRLESSRLAWAFVISLAVHLFCFGGYKAGNRYDWWQSVHWPAWLTAAQQSVAKLLGKEANKPAAVVEQREVPLMFVDVNPALATTEAPKNAKYYSDRNSRAANPDANVDSNIPKITGTQTQVVRTEDVPRTKAFPLQPALPAPPGAQQQEEARPKPAPPPGDLVMAKPQQPIQESGQATESRPRTIREALARQQQRTGLVGEKMKQEGGVKRRAIESSLDAIATPFGAYDRAIVLAVQNRWYYLLDSGDFARERTGKVVLEFHLNYDGRIADMKVAENTVTELLCLLCQKAILDPAPYEKWPSDLRRMVGADYREVRFTFFYN